MTREEMYELGLESGQKSGYGDGFTEALMTIVSRSRDIKGLKKDTHQELMNLILSIQTNKFNGVSK